MVRHEPVVVCEFVPTVCLTEAFEDHERQEEQRQILQEIGEAKQSLTKAVKLPKSSSFDWKYELGLGIQLFNLGLTGVVGGVLTWYIWNH